MWGIKKSPGKPEDLSIFYFLQLEGKPKAKVTY